MKKREAVTVLFLALLAGAGVFLLFQKPEVKADTVTTVRGTVQDRAMSEGISYISVETEADRTLMCWNLYDRQIPETVTVGSIVEITYGLEEAHNRYVLLEVEKLVS